jgi:hypothetical protein
LARADLLLLLQASADTIDLIPAKIYEYLHALKPLLALVHPGATSELLGTVGGGWAADLAMRLRWKTHRHRVQRRSNRLAAYNATGFRFDRKALAGELPIF